MIVFDLDGTLALDHHRSHYLKGDVKYWDEYFNACVHDELNEPIANQLRKTWADNERIGVWTGRSAKVRDITIEWLERHQLWSYIDDFRMREADDRTQDDLLKLQWLNEARAAKYKVTLVFEDRQRVVDMWRSEGIVCCQVAPGAF